MVSSLSNDSSPSSTIIIIINIIMIIIILYHTYLESSGSDEEDNSLNNSLNNSLDMSFTDSHQSSSPVTYMSRESDYLNDNMAKTFNVVNKPFQMFNTRKNKSHKFITAQKQIRKIDKSKVKLVNFFAKPLY